MCDGAIKTIAGWRRACKHAPYKPFWFCVGVVFGLSSFAENILGQQILVPGTWYDQDKYHLASEPVGGDSWQRNYGKLSNGSHDPGEPVSETRDWIPSIILPDNSCWMAGAANLVQHRTGQWKYQSWAYDDGITGDFIEPWGNVGNATYTFDEGGFPHYGLQHQGLAWTVMAQDSGNFAWLDPIEYITASLKEGDPVSIGIYSGWSSGHALTIYGINTITQTITVADSDVDKSGQDYAEYSYSQSGNEITIAYDTSQINLRYISSFDDVGWWTAGSGAWSAAGNWASKHAPTSSQTVYLTQSNIDTVTINSAANAKSLVMSAQAKLEIISGTLSVTNDVRYDGLLELYSSGSRISCNDLYVGDQGIGNFTQTGGTNTTNHLHLGINSGSSGTYNLTGGILILKSISKGSGTAAFNFGGGTIQASDNFSTTLPVTLTGNGGNANVDTADYAVALSGQLSGLGGLNKLGAGMLTLTGNNNYADRTTVVAGTLVLDSDARSPVLTGGGADVQAGKFVFNYTSPAEGLAATIKGLLAASYATGWTSGQFISSTATSSQGLGWYDQFDLAVIIQPALYGDADLNGTVNVDDLIKVLTAYNHTDMVWSEGDFTYDGTVNADDLIKVLANYNQSMGLTGSSVGMAAGITAVPEPGTLLLLISAAAVVAGLRPAVRQRLRRHALRL